MSGKLVKKKVKKAPLINRKMRLRAYEQMTPAAQEVATECAANFKKDMARRVLHFYDLGARVTGWLADEATFGPDFLKQLAIYLALPGGDRFLLDLQRFAMTFDRKVVAEWSGILSDDGTSLSLTHWLILMRIADPDERMRVLQEATDGSLSSIELRRSLQGSQVQPKKKPGRSPGIPSSPIIGLQTLVDVSQRLNRYVPVVEEHAFDVIEHMSADSITPAIKARLEEAIRLLDECARHSTDAVVHAQKCLRRVSRVLRQKEAVEQPDAREEAQPPRKRILKPRAGAHALRKKKKKIRQKAV